MEAVSLGKVFKECKALVQPLADKDRIQLDCDTDIDGYVMADHTRLKQILLNLLSNAIKYNHPNGKVSVRCRPASDDHIRIEVNDTGYGIPHNKLGGLFEPFNRLDINTKKIEGTGIGLSISKKLAEMMNGTLNVRSNIGQGSTFWIELEGCQPRGHKQASCDHWERPSEPLYQGSDLTKTQKILVVEDNPTNLKLISSQISTLGYKADLASNGKEALELAATGNYALVLTDCNMPVMDGYELTAELRKNNSLVPIIALTADAFPERERECLTAGMNGRIIKPVSLQQLDSMLETWL